MSLATIPGGSLDHLRSALLVDHDDDTRRMYRDYLTAANIDVEEASDGPEALVKALSKWHDVIVTETRLPRINGYELCTLLRRDESTRKAAIVVVTGDPFDENVSRARAAGADEVLVKPCLPEDLLEHMRGIVRRSRALRQHARSVSVQAANQIAKSQELQDRISASGRRMLSQNFDRGDKILLETEALTLTCPKCDRPLQYQRSHIGGVNERSAEQWDYYKCRDGCGTFQYRQRTRKLRRVY